MTEFPLGISVLQITVFALRFQNLPARNSSLKIFKHEKEEKLSGPNGKLAGPAQFLVAKGLGPALNAKTEIKLHFDSNCFQTWFVRVHLTLSHHWFK